MALDQAVEAQARVVVLRGRGETWSAGYDVAEIPAEIFSEDAQTVAAHPFERCMSAVRQCPRVVVAATCGDVFGGGLELAASCDLVIARNDARFGLTPARLGLVYSHTGLHTLVRRIGSAHARMLVLTGRTVDAEEAARVGLVNEVSTPGDFERRLAALAADVAARAPLALSGMKHVLGLLERIPPLTEEEHAAILRIRNHAYRSDDFREGQAAFRDKRAPRFRGR